MKQIFYKGLLALTIAFGMTSCDKNELPDAPALGVVVNDEYSKVSFGEVGNSIVVPKLKGASSEASKNASEFTHIYSSIASQTLDISNNGGSVYSGAYKAGRISSLDPSTIILANGLYTASSANVSNQSDAVVLGFLPYTSSASFDLETSGTITLAATLERGFLIVNAEAEAADGNRVVGATVKGEALIGPDDEGDFYGYLLAGVHPIVVTYMLDNVATEVTGSEDIAVGSAYTINLSLEANQPAGPVLTSTVATETTVSTEALLAVANPGRVDGGDINGDGDTLDGISRIKTTTTMFSDDVPVDSTDALPNPRITNGAWSVIDGQDFSAADFAEPIDQNDGGSSTATDTTDDSGDDDDDASDDFVDATFSDWDPAFGTQIAGFTQERTVSNSEANLDDDVVLELSRDITVTGEITTAATIGVAGVMTYSATDADGVAVGVSHDVDIDALPDYVAATFSDWAEAFLAQTADFTQTRTVSNGDANLDDSIDLVLSRDITVSYDVTTAPLVGVAGVGTYSADNGITFTHTVVIDALPMENVILTRADFTDNNDTWTGPDGRQFLVTYSPAGLIGYYFQIWDGSAYGDASTPIALADSSAAADDAAYLAAADAAIATYNN